MNTWTKGSDGTWLIAAPDGKEGEVVTILKKSGEEQEVKLGAYVETVWGKPAFKADGKAVSKTEKKPADPSRATGKYGFGASENQRRAMKKMARKMRTIQMFDSYGGNPQAEADLLERQADDPKLTLKDASIAIESAGALIDDEM